MSTLTATMPIVPTESSAAFKKLVVAYDFSPYADTALDYAERTLIAADDRLTPPVVRRFFERLKRTDDAIIHHLIRFYFYAEGTEGDRRDKLDFLFTRIGEDFSADRGEYWSRDSLEFRERIIALVSILHVSSATPGEVVKLIRAVRSMREEVSRIKRFEELTERHLLRNVRLFKHRIGDLYFHPDVLLAIVELNVATKNRFLKLYIAEEQKLVDDSSKLMEHGMSQSMPAAPPISGGRATPSIAPIIGCTPLAMHASLNGIAP